MTEELKHNLAVYATPWGLCVTAEQLAPCTDNTVDEVIALAGAKAHSGWYNGAMRDFIELEAISPSPNAKLTLWNGGIDITAEDNINLAGGTRDGES